MSGSPVDQSVPAHRWWPRPAAVLLALAAGPAWAIDIQVDVLGDPAPDGCTPGSCSLREAVSLANSLAGPDRILLPATPGVPLQLTIPGANEHANATGDLDVLDDLEIVGTGVATTLLVQTTQDRVLQAVMPQDGRLVLRGLTIQGGSASQGGALLSQSLTTIEDVAFVGNTASYEGGAVHFTASYDPAILETRLVLRRVRFQDNAATQANDAYGGALHATSFINDAPVAAIEDCQFIGNSSTSGGGAVWLTGSINWAGGDVAVRRSLFSANSSGRSGGAALMATSSSFRLRIEDSLFDDNVTTSSDPSAAGAINLDRYLSVVMLRSTFSANSGNRGGAVRSAYWPVQVIDSHFVDNTAAFAGGALWAGSQLVVRRSTFESNRVASTSSADDGGGAIGFAGTALDLRDSTFSGNDAFRGGAISLVAGEMRLIGNTLAAPAFGVAGRMGTAIRIIDADPDNALILTTNIVSGSCTFPSGGRQLAAAYANIEAPGNSCRFTTAPSNGQNHVSATSAQLALGPLSENGGPTPTRLPGAGSIAIDLGGANNCAATDQRGYARIDALCDIGAVEVGAIPDALFGNGFD
jgi:hypothetical protein